MTSSTGAASNLGSRVTRFFSTKPIISNSLFCLGSWTLGDVAVQFLEHKYHNSVSDGPDKSFEWNQTRTFHIASFGVLINGPVYAKWYPWLDGKVKTWKVHQYHDTLMSKYVKNQNSTVAKWLVPRKSMMEPITKLLIEITTFDIPFLSFFFGYMNVLRGGTWEDFKHKIRHELPQTYMTSVGFWSAAQLWNFRFVPIVYQSVFVHVVSIVWDGFLSYRNEVSSHNANIRKQQQQESTIVVEDQQEKIQTD